MTNTNDISEYPEHEVKTILVVDDNTYIGEFITLALKTETAYQGLCVTNALQALETAKKLVPDLFLLDYQLPDINGLELADRLQATEALKHIPILLMSANLPKQEAEKRHLAFLEKPFGMDELLQTIEKLLVS